MSYLAASLAIPLRVGRWAIVGLVVQGVAQVACSLCIELGPVRGCFLKVNEAGLWYLAWVSAGPHHSSSAIDRE